MSSERNALPGGPSNVLIRKVRRQLGKYGIRPTFLDGKLWNMTWDWAHAIALNEDMWCRIARVPRKRMRWPLADEIAAQYVFLLLMEMRERRALKLPARAADQTTPAVRTMLSAMPGAAVVPMIEQSQARIGA